MRAQIALIIDTGLMWYEAGKIDSYACEVWNARNYARNMEYKEITDILDPAWEEVEPIELASEQWRAKTTTEQMVTDALEHFKTNLELAWEIKARADLKPDDFIVDIVNVLVIYGIEDPLAVVTRMGWAKEV